MTDYDRIQAEYGNPALAPAGLTTRLLGDQPSEKSLFMGDPVEANRGANEKARRLLGDPMDIMSDDDEIQVVREFKPQSSLGAFVTVFKAICGTGILSLPYSVRMFGLVNGTVGMAFFGVVSLYTTRLLVNCSGGVRDTMHASEYESKDMGYDDIGRRAFGGSAWFGWVTAVSTVFCQLGTCCSIIIFIVTNMEQAVHESELAIALPVSICVILLAQLRSTGLLWPTSILGNFSLVGSVVLVFYYGFADTEPFRPLAADDISNFSGFSTFFGLGVFTFSAHAEALSIEQNMRNTKKFGTVLNWMYVVVTALYMTFGIMGFLFFRDHTEQIIFLNLPKGSIYVKTVMVLMSAVVLFSFPINLFPATVIIEDLIVPHKFVDRRCLVECIRTAVRLITVVGCVFLSLHFRKVFGPFTAFVGALTNGIIAFILPPMMYNNLFKSTVSWSVWGLNIVIIIFGTVSSIFATTVLGLSLFLDINI